MCDKPKEFSYGRCFSIIYRHGKTINDRMIRKFHLSGGQSRYLARICDNPGISQEELAQYYQIDKGAIAKSVRRMGELGYVKREQNQRIAGLTACFQRNVRGKLWIFAEKI